MYNGLSLDQAPPLSVPFRFFFTAPLFALLGSLSLMFQGPELASSAMSGLAIGWIHLWSLGWLTMIMFGAFYQLIPVMIGGQVPWGWASKWVHGLLVFGVLSFWAYFTWPELLSALWPLASLGLAMLVFLSQTSLALYRVSQQSRPTLEAMRIATSSLAFAALLGLSRLIEFLGGPGFVGDIRVAHLSVALVGWVAMLLIGVSYHLLPMFYVCPPFDSVDAYRVIRLISISLVAVTVGNLFELGPGWIGALSSFGLLGIGLYLYRFKECISARRRKKVDPALRLFIAGLLWMATGVGTWALSLSGVIDGTEVSVMVWLLGFGLSVTHSMSYKIVPFLIWFHRFSPYVGKQPTPTLADIFPVKRQQIDFWLLQVGLVLLFVGFLFQSELSLRVSGVFLFANHLLLLSSYVKAVQTKLQVPGTV